jgi:hypothetical protein
VEFGGACSGQQDQGIVPMTDAATAAQSVRKLEDGAAVGPGGTRWPAGSAQQAGVEQRLESQPEQQQVFVREGLGLARLVNSPCQSRRNPSVNPMADFVIREPTVAAVRFSIDSVEPITTRA